MEDFNMLVKEQVTSDVTPTFESDIKLDRWIFERIRPFVTGRVLEIDDGVGFVTPICEENGIAADVMHIDLSNGNFDILYANLLQTFDTLIFLNKEEQIVKNQLENCSKLLKGSGYLITRLSGHTALYNGLDQGLVYWKKHNWKYINSVLNRRFEILKARCYILSDCDKICSDKPFTMPIELSEYQQTVRWFRTKQAEEFHETGLSFIIVGKMNL